MKATLTMLPDGRGILTLPDGMTDVELAHVREVWDHWKETPEAVLFFMGTVEHATTVELELPDPVPA